MKTYKSLFKVSKLKLFIVLILLLIFSLLTLVFSNEARYNLRKGVLTATYLDFKNYILMLSLALIFIYFIASQIYMFIKEKSKYWLLILIINILLLLGLTPYALNQSIYKDFIGLHIDKFIGWLLLLFSISEIIILSLFFLIKQLIKLKK